MTPNLASRVGDGQRGLRSDGISRHFGVTCPKCGNKPLSFATFLVTINPWKIRCVNCGESLRVGPLGYLWVALHVLLGLGLVKLYLGFAVQGVIATPAGVLMFVAASLALVFMTAYVIPWMFFDRLYHVAEN
jgi:uncharacterized protein (DUF983 family)